MAGVGTGLHIQQLTAMHRCQRCGRQISPGSIQLGDDEIWCGFGGMAGAAVGAMGGGTGGGGGRSGNAGAAQNVKYDPLDHIKKAFKLGEAFPPDVVNDMASDALRLLKRESVDHRYSLGELRRFFNRVLRDHPKLPEPAALKVYIHRKMNIPVIQFLCNRYCPSVQHFENVYGRWKNEAFARLGYVEDIRGVYSSEKVYVPRINVIGCVFEYVVGKYGGTDLDTMALYCKAEENVNKQLRDWMWNYMEYLQRTTFGGLFKKKKSFEAYVKKYKK